MDKDEILGVIFILIIVTIAVILTAFNGYNFGYEDGQIDVLTGHAYYELIDNDDMIRQWEYTKEEYEVKCQ